MLLRFNRALLLGLLTTSVLVASVDGQETEKKTFFLPKSPVAAAYVLGRLSNKELAEAPRSEFVFVALLQRKGLERRYRVEAVEGLAKIHSTDPLTELLNGLGELDKKGEASESVLRDLSTILLQYKPESLAAKRDLLLKLAAESQLGITRQIACAAVVTADGSGERRWKEVDSNPGQLADLLLSLLFIRDLSIRAAFHSKVEPLIHKVEPAEVRRAAILALAAVAGRESESFTALAAFVRSGEERETAIVSLQKIPRKSWPAGEVESLMDSLVAWLQGVPVDKRTETDAVNAFQFANDLAALLPPDKAAAAGKTLRALGVRVFVIRTIPERMLYDKNLIVVEAGKPVSLILINDDAMPHNLVVTLPGAVAEIGPITETMPPDPDSSGRLYIPSSPKILHGTKLVEPGQQASLSFVAPKEPGDYQYVCTFPGHWRLMVGKLAVVEDVEAYLATHAAAAQPKITEWKTDDLVPQLSKLDSGRNLQQGRESFTRLACASCHKLGSEGASYGPELTDVFSRYQNNPTEVLRQIIEPSLIVSNRYRGFDFELQNGDELSGMVVKEEGDLLTVQTGPAASLVQTLKKSAITTQKPQKSSLMPVGLINTLSAEDLLDLLAFIRSGGGNASHEHHH